MTRTRSRLARIPFAWRLTAAFAATVLVVGVVQYTIGAHQLSARVLEQTLAGYEGDAKVMSDVHPGGGWDAVIEVLGHISHRPASLAAGIVGPDEVVVASGADFPHGQDDEDAPVPAETHAPMAEPHIVTGERVSGTDRSIVHEVFARDRPRFSVDEGYEHAVAVYGVPIELGGESYALLVDTEMSLVGEQLASLRTTLLAGLAMVVLLGVPLFYIIGGRRLSALVRHHERRAVRDALTDLSNHRAFQERIREEVARARRGGQPLTIALLDLDGFKLVNDTMGHRRGDEMLAEVGAILVTGREDDLAFRIGGDEFALLLPGTDVEGAREVAGRLRTRITRQLPEIGVSVGLAEVGRDAVDVEALLACADAAMYRAKRRGRSLVVAFADLGPAEAEATLTKGTALQALLAEAEMRVVFQPVLDLQDGSVLGYEALARPPEVAGFCGPGEAFETAEQLGLVPELDALCRRAVLERAVELPSDVQLFLNIAPAALDHDLLDWWALGHEVRTAGLTPDRVVIELTERSRVAASVLQREVAQAREVGFRIAVDDVGAGWTGFECLRAAEPDIIKVDRAIVAAAGTDDTARATLVSALVYAEVVGADVIGEGVEDVEVLRLLQGPLLHGVTSARVAGVQGYLFGRPAEVPTAPDRSVALR